MLLILGLGLFLVGCGSGTSASSSPATQPPAVATSSPVTANPLPGMATAQAVLVSPQALQDVTAAARKTEATTAAVQLSLSTAVVFTRTPSPVRGHGALDFGLDEGSLTLTPAASAHLPAGVQSAVIFFPRVAYSQPVPGSRQGLPPGKRWLALDLSGAGTASTNLPQFLPQIESFNPRLSLDELIWGAVAASAVGRTSRAGVKATLYTVTVDLRTALARASGPNQAVGAAVIASQIRALGGTGGNPRIEQQVWVDGHGRVVKLLASSLTGVGTVAVTFGTFGSPVAVRPPPRSQVFEATSLGPSSERENNGRGDSDGA